MSASSTGEMETLRTTTGRKQLRRQPSRLQMHAPSSIEVAHAAGWNVAIPLLSPVPFDDDAVAAVPWASACETAVADPTPTREEQQQEEEDHQQQQQEVGGAQWQTWRHPAIPFCYEAAPGNSTRPAFLLPHCA